MRLYLSVTNEELIMEDEKYKLKALMDSLEDEGVLDAYDADRSENLHRLFMYPAMMVPSAQTAVVTGVSKLLPEKIKAVDPFMGSGTSLLSCMEIGADIYGQDINPLAVLLSKVKTHLFDVDGLLFSFDSLKERISNDYESSIDVSFPNIDKWFNKGIQFSLSKIRRAIKAETNELYRDFFWINMAEAIRIGSNDRTSTFKLHQRTLTDIQSRNIDIILEFFKFTQRAINDIKKFREKLIHKGSLIGNSYVGSIETVWGNSQESILSDERHFNLLVSSPPYGDNHTTVTYGQASYLPLQWIDPRDLDCPFDYLRTTQEIDAQSLGGHISKKKLREKVDSIFLKSNVLREFYLNVPDEEKQKYNKTLSFIIDFDESLKIILSKMTNDAYYIWTIGNRSVGGREIPNSLILKDLMMNYGITLQYTAERQIHNKKQPNRNSSSRTMEKEHVMIFHKE